MSKITNKEKATTMAATVKPIIELINKRIKSRLETLETLSSQPLDNNLPDEIRIKREDEASKIRAVLQEQSDLIEIIQALFP